MTNQTGLRLSLLAAFSISCLSTTPCMAQGLFLDSQFDVRITSGIVYGTAPISSPPGDFDLLLDLYEPIGPDAPAVRPGFVIIHGGGFTGGSRTESPVVTLATEMAARGYTAISIDYRLLDQKPELSAEFRPFFLALQAKGFGTWMARAIAASAEDATRAHRWMVEQAGRLELDTQRIAVGGGSAGAITSLVSGYVLDDNGVTDVPEIGVVLDQCGTIDGFLDCMETDEPPLFIVHGKKDELFDISNAKDLARKAAHEGIPFEFHAIPRAGHGFDLFTIEVAPGVTIFDRVVGFFYEQLSLEDLVLDMAIETLIDAVDSINSLGPLDLLSEDLRQALINQVDTVLRMVAHGYYVDAQAKLLTDTLKRVDGCATLGYPDRNDWIITCDGQNQVYPFITMAIVLLGDLID